jgi:uncharacterized protein (DUF1501 family)
LQSSLPVEAEFSRTFKGIFSDNVELAKLPHSALDSTANFADTDIGRRLRATTKLARYYKSLGANRQVFLIDWGRFDTHANQRYQSEQGAPDGQDTQLRELSQALVSFQNAIEAAGMANEIVTLVMSEFGRTLDPAAGFGSDHAWGNHWMVMGSPVKGGQFYGQTFPRLILEGPDDADPGGRGHFLPQLPCDAVAADLVQWLGLPPADLLRVFPNLANFSAKGVGFV